MHRLVSWITHHIGSGSVDPNIKTYEWWGYMYQGLPSYVSAENIYTSGLTIQRYVPPKDSWTLKRQEEGKTGWAYGPPETLMIPEAGVILERQVSTPTSRRLSREVAKRYGIEIPEGSDVTVDLS
jgi:hypothetical protein